MRRAFLRGGNWNNGTNAGSFALNLNNTPGNQNNNVGARCASDVPRLPGAAPDERYVSTDPYPGPNDHRTASIAQSWILRS